MKGAIVLATVVGAALLSLVLLLATRSPDAEAQPARDVIPDRYIVVLKNSAPDPQRVAASEEARGTGLEVSHVYRDALKGFAARIPSRRLPALRADSRVLFVAEDRKVRASAQRLPTGVNRIEADRSSTEAGNGVGAVNVGVAILDTGIDLDHPDLNVAGGRNCSTGTTFDDGNGHGTHVAGTVAAKDNRRGVVGVAPGAPLYAVRVLNDRGSGSLSSAVCGIDWVTANAQAKGIEVANMSLGGPGLDDGDCGNFIGDPMHRAICNSVNGGVTYVTAAGNSGVDFLAETPAAYDEVLTVTAMADFNGRPGGGAAPTCRRDADETAADFSNFTTVGGDEDHTVAAPGVCIRSTFKGGTYKTISGTSMASPHIAGMAALCIQSGGCSGLSPDQIIDKLRADAAARPRGYGFAEDPNRVTGPGSRYYGHLGWAGGY